MMLDIGVHQHCYGITTIPLGPWLCVSCSTGVKNPSCAYCPNKDDRAFHQLKRGGFVHTSCAFWCPELRFSSKQGIGGLVLGKPLRQRLSLVILYCWDNFLSLLMNIYYILNYIHCRGAVYANRLVFVSNANTPSASSPSMVCFMCSLLSNRV